jgi:hypothetical protein
MIIVRYATLVALVIWLGVMVGARLGELVGRLDVLSYVCAGGLVVGLFMMKFLGPPPPGFITRVVIVVLMLGIAVASALFAITPDLSKMLSLVNIGLGLALLFWYVRE